MDAARREESELLPGWFGNRGGTEGELDPSPRGSRSILPWEHMGLSVLEHMGLRVVPMGGVLLH